MMIMMIKEKGDVRPLLVKFGVALAISFAGFLYAQVRHKRIRPLDPPPSLPSTSGSIRRVDSGGRLWISDDPQPEVDADDEYNKPCIRVRADSVSVRAPPSGRYTEDKDGFLLPEFDQLVKDVNTSNAAIPDIEDFTTKNELPNTIFSVERDDYELEIDNLKRRVNFLRERERKLEVQVLEYYGLKEQETAMMELQNRLKINNIEAKLFSVKIESLQAENKRLAAQVFDYSKVVSELEDAKDKIRVLKRKIRHEAQQNKDQIIELTQRVAQFREQEHEHAHSELHRMVHLEREVEELRKFNESLQQENADLIRRLDSTQFLANSLLDDPEKDELSKEMYNLREENESLSKEVERLRADRCTDAEELVYLRWINACLRYELRNYQPPPGKTVARDLSKGLSPTSEKKAKQLILEYANSEDGDRKGPGSVDFDFDHWPSSNQSYLTDSTEHDDSPRHNTSDHKHHHKKLKIFARLRRLIMGKHSHTTRVDHDILKRRSSESPRGESFYDGGIDESPKLASSSQNSHTSSLEFQPLSRLDEQDEERTDRMSESRSLTGGTRFVLGSENANCSPFDYRTEHDSEDVSKLRLAKYAEALRDTRSSPRAHKKSASCA